MRISETWVSLQSRPLGDGARITMSRSVKDPFDSILMALNRGGRPTSGAAHHFRGGTEAIRRAKSALREKVMISGDKHRGGSIKCRRGRGRAPADRVDPGIATATDDFRRRVS